MTAFPLAPRLARALCSAAHLNCLIEAIIVISMLYVAPVFYVPQESREEFNEISTRFRHLDGDLASLVLVYRAYVKAAETSNNIDGGPTVAIAASTRLARRNRWCRENFINQARMRTAVKVRIQLRDLVKSSGLGRLHSCGSDDFSPLTKAFFEVAFRDQVATLATNRTDSSTNRVRESFPYYKRLEDTDPSSPLLCIHPDSSIYPLAIVARCPPPAVLFLEAVDSSSVPFSDTHQRVMMRHVCRIPSSWLGDENMEAVEAIKADVEESRLSASTQESDEIAATSNVISLSEHVVNVENAWSEIGYCPSKHIELQESLMNNVTKILTDELSSAESEKAEILCKIDQMRVEIAEIEKELQIPRKQISSQSLLSILDELTGYRSELDRKIAELNAEFKKLKSNEENLCQLLHVATLKGFPLIPSYNDKLRVQHHIDELQDVKRHRVDKLAKMRQRILSCIDYLKSDCNLTLPEPISGIVTMNVEPLDLSEAFLEEMDRTQDLYMDLFHKFKSEEDELFENIDSLRKRLGLPPFTLPKEHSKCPSRRINYGSEELSRLRELRLANLRHLMEASVLELEGIWADALVSTDYRQNFRDSMPMDCTEENLSRLEEEVHRWRRFKSSHQDFYDALMVWLDTLRQIKAIELKRQDPTVLKNRGGILLKLDKEDRKLRTRDLPNQTAHLESIIANECVGSDIDQFSLVCFEGQPLTGQKNSLTLIIDKNLEPSGNVATGPTSTASKTTKSGFVYA
ncbi:unnamed protein product, partial [Hydatigera taeniaeformis]|uniref:RNA helicase n=1 Tax=Hydatigena taeniaeformis TaxID=6205 RepID=A0A158RFB5_HYDTA